MHANLGRMFTALPTVQLVDDDEDGFVSRTQAERALRYVRWWGEGRWVFGSECVFCLRE